MRLDDWSALRSGQSLRIVKLSPGGETAAEYPGIVLDRECPTPWIAVAADWTHPSMEFDGLRFVTGDNLTEYFSTQHWFNVFAVHSPEQVVRGWYANVTRPSWIEEADDVYTLFWHDLYIDLIGLPGGRFTIRDEDELETSNLAERDPGLYQSIVDAQSALTARFAGGEFPFTMEPELDNLWT